MSSITTPGFLSGFKHYYNDRMFLSSFKDVVKLFLDSTDRKHLFEFPAISDVTRCLLLAQAMKNMFDGYSGSSSYDNTYISEAVGFDLCGYTDDVPSRYRDLVTTIHELPESFVHNVQTVIEMRQGSPLVALLPAPEDIALSKLDRLSEKDVADIVALMGHPGASWELLQKLTEEAEKYYPGIKGGLTSKLNYVIKYKRT